MAKVKNDDNFFDFDDLSGWKDLIESVNLLPPQFTSLIPKIGDNDPDEAFSSVSYEKGFNLLYNLERRVGSDSFEAFAKAYLHKFKFSTVTSFEFKDFLSIFLTVMPISKTLIGKLGSMLLICRRKLLNLIKPWRQKRFF